MKRSLIIHKRYTINVKRYTKKGSHPAAPVFKPGNLLICLDEHFQQWGIIRCLQADEISASRQA